MPKLTATQRANLPPSAFVFPKTREFPIPDESHAAAAIRLAGRETPARQKQIRAAVFKRYPNLNPKNK